MSSLPETLVRTSEPPRLRLGRRLRELFRHREVLLNLIRKETKVKYTSSVLGVAWSMLNPVLYLLVFYVVFTFFLPSGISNFVVYLLAGIVPWTLFSTGLQGATGSVVANGPLVTKVAFPREILPLSAIGAAVVNFGYQSLVLLAALLIFTYPFLGPALVLVPLAVVVLLLFVTAVGLATSAFNVRYRDTQHLVDLALLAWFWVTPIVYQGPKLVAENLGARALQLYLLNPLANVVLAFQRALYGGTSRLALYGDPARGIEPALPDPGIAWYAGRLGAVGAVSLLLLYLTWRAFYRMSGDFAEEL
jgi:ABC-2 type transport system permease protein